jgi:hypothetical protein
VVARTNSIASNSLRHRKPRAAIRDELRFLAETWDEQLADLQNMITDFERKYFEGLRAASTLAAVERDDSTRLH